MNDDPVQMFRAREQREIESQLSRRDALKGALATAVVVAPRTAFAQQPLQTHMPPGVTPKPKGPLVFGDYDQEELDAAYDQVPWSPNRPEIDKRNAQKNVAALARLGQPARLAYGPTDIERLDVYKTRRSDAPIHVHIHGGTWRTGRSADVAFMAEMYVDAGAHFVALDFTNVTESKGNLLTMAQQVRRAVAWLHGNAASFGGDRNQIYISGHSSGAHLAAVVLTTDWRKSFDLPADTVKGGLCLSGMYELHPVSLSARRSYVNFTAETLDALSPQRHLDQLRAPVIVAYGTLETPEFQRQNREFAAVAKAAGKPVELIVLDGCNHFEGQESLGNPYGVLGRAILRQMKLRPWQESQRTG